MCGRVRTVRLAATLLVLGATGVAPVFAAGYWNVPGNFCQCCGYGCSGGYHAPFILGPIQFDGWGPPNEVRLPCPPPPICGCTGGSDCGRQFEATSSLGRIVPMIQPTPAHAVQPAAAPEAAKSADAPTVPSSPTGATTTDSTPAESKRTRPIFEPPVQN